MAVNHFGANISWHWVEDFSPFPIAGLYQKYWTVDGAFSNPSLVLIDTNQSIVGVYHVYCIGKGSIDGIQTAESLAGDARSIVNGTWKGLGENLEDEGLTFAGIFILGILTSVTPCSLALLVAMISYVGSLQKDSENGIEEIFPPRVMDRNYLYPGYVSCIFCVRDDTSHPLVSFLKHQLCFTLSQGLFLLFSVSISSSHLASLYRRNLKKEQVQDL